MRGGTRRRWPWVVLGIVVLLAAGLVWNYWPQAPPDPVPGNGPVASADEPWTVVISEPGRYDDVPSAKGCVGTLVAPRAVVTAAHCLYGHAPSEFRVIGGRTDLRTGEGRTVAVTDLWTAPGYPVDQGLFDGVGSTLDSPPDIGVMLLATDLPYRTLPLAAPGAGPQAGAVARYSGWRVSVADEPVLWQSPTTVVGDDRCREVAAGGRSYFPNPVLHGYRYDPAAYLCAGEGDRAVPVRASDSGSPLVVDGRLAGVGGWAPDFSRDAPRFYARVSTYTDEIQRLVTTAGTTGRFRP